MMIKAPGSEASGTMVFARIVPFTMPGPKESAAGHRLLNDAMPVVAPTTTLRASDRPAMPSRTANFTSSRTSFCFWARLSVSVFIASRTLPTCSHTVCMVCFAAWIWAIASSCFCVALSPARCRCPLTSRHLLCASCASSPKDVRESTAHDSSSLCVRPQSSSTWALAFAAAAALRPATSSALPRGSLPHTEWAASNVTPN
mmetsp:Transcript_25121/g.72386  ORF Transcript_25121/g.72386 Transcript_25121/m.72386 type:complete len:201 (+) Transcript_25121:870-1472(+)